MKTGIASLLFFFGCSTPQKTITTQPAPPIVPAIQDKQPVEEDFDPASLGDSWNIKPQTFPERIRPYHELPDDTNRFGGEKETLTIGFRVQITSTTNYYEALAIRDSAGSHISDEIYLDYEPPYYKVRVGNYRTQEDAEFSKNLVKSAGYHDAWIVRTKIVRREK